MSRNRNNRRSSRKPANTGKEVSQAEQIKADLEQVSGAKKITKTDVAQPVKETKATAAAEAGNAVKSTSEAAKAVDNTDKNADKKPLVSKQPDKDKGSQAKVQSDKREDKREAKQTGDTNGSSSKSQAKIPGAKDAPAKEAPGKKPQLTEKARTLREQPKTTAKQASKPSINYAKSEKKSGRGFVVFLALLLGIAGTGLGAYAFNEIRLLKSNVSAGDIATKVATLTQQISSVEAAQKDLGSQIKSDIQAALAENVKKIDAVEKMQIRLDGQIKQQVDNALKTRLAQVESLLAKVKDIELGQQGLSKNLSEVTTATHTVSESGMLKQEAAYLLTMANYKAALEADAASAAKLLKVAENKLVAANDDTMNQLIDGIRTKQMQLSGVKQVDINPLIMELAEVSTAISQLSPKSQQSQQPASATEPSGTAKTEQGVLGKIGSVIASGVKYTPKDPSKIDVSAETALIEKRLMQADVKAAELAIRSRNDVLLKASIASIRNSLDKFFVADATAKAINEKLDNLSNSELKTVLPDLSELVKQFKQQL